MKPKISVIIPAHNAQRYIKKCLASLERQTFKEFEVILVDDCSSDKTAELAAKHNVRVVAIHEQSGPGHARNVGAQNSSGEILAFTDVDVILPADWISNFINIMESQQVKCVASGYRESVGNRYIQILACAELEHRRMHLPKFVNTFVANSFSCYREVFFTAGGFPENYKSASSEDLIFSYKVSRRYKVFWDINNGVSHHFRDSLRGYFSQQYIFARDAVVTYLELPEMLLINTHHGKKLYLEVLVLFLALLGASLTFYVPLSGVLLIGLINFNFLIFARKKYHLSAAKVLPTIILRDIIILIGVIVGFFVGIKARIK